MTSTLLLLPITAFIANALLGFFILYNNPKEHLNRLFTLVAISLATWSLADLMFFSATSSPSATFWDKISTFGSSMTVAFLLHFFIVFSRRRIPRLSWYIPLYGLQLAWVAIAFSTSLIDLAIKSPLERPMLIPGILYLPYTLSITAYTIAGLALAYRVYRQSTSDKERRQARLLIVAVIVPLVAGIVTEIIPEIAGIRTIRLTSTLSTFTAAVIAYAMIRYGLMRITPEMAAENIIETMTDYLLVFDH